MRVIIDSITRLTLTTSIQIDEHKGNLAYLLLFWFGETWRLHFASCDKKNHNFLANTTDSMFLKKIPEKTKLIMLDFAAQKNLKL